MKIKKMMAITAIALSLVACTKEESKPVIKGCTNPTSLNYNPSATENDGSCIAKVYGCTDPTSTNYNPSANIDDGSCKYQGNATFWYNSGGTNATVTISTPSGNQVGTINGNYYYTSTPSCGANYCANFTLPVGVYGWSAVSTFNTWNGTITITKNHCSTMLLH